MELNISDSSQVSAVVLTIGAPTLQEALRHVNAQTVRLAKIIRVDGVTPFYRALNYGARQVETSYFIQVDEDMLLDPDCVEKLIAGIEPDVGMVIGHLQDPMVGPEVGVKLFRTACALKFPLKNTASPETDFLNAIEKDGWKTVYIGGYGEPEQQQWETVGLHRPDYSPRNAFEKFLREGRKLNYRKKLGAFYSLLHTLRFSSHENATIAQIGLCQGIFLVEDYDILQPLDQSPGNAYYRCLQELIQRDKQGGDLEKFNNLLFDINFSEFAIPSKVFRMTCLLGNNIYREGSFGDFKEILQTLWQNEQPYSWVGIIGLCHGIFREADHESTKLFMDFYHGDRLEGKSFRAIWKRCKASLDNLLIGK